MATKKITAAIKAIPSKKADLKKAFDALQSSSSALASFTLKWNDLDAHFSALEKSINDRFSELQAKELEKSPKNPVQASLDDELASLCAKMDGKTLISFIADHRNEIHDTETDLCPALLAASDPALLVLNAVHDFYPPKTVPHKDGQTHTIRRFCMDLLECVPTVAPEISPPVRQRAKKLAADWRGKLSDRGGDNGLEVMAFLQLLISYKLVAEYKTDEVLDVLVLISRRKQTIDLIKKLGVIEKVPDLIEKLSNKGKQLDAVKIVYAFNLLDKFPPIPLLKSYITYTKDVAEEVRKKGKNSTQLQNEADAKELGALNSVLKAIEDYKVESLDLSKDVEGRIARIEQHKAGRQQGHRTAGQKRIHPNHQQQQQKPDKRPWPATYTSAPTVCADPRPPLVQSPYMGMAGAGSYGGGISATGSLYHQAGSNLGGPPMGLGDSRSQPGSHLYSSGAGDLYDRPATYNNYSLSGLPASYRPSFYP